MAEPDTAPGPATVETIREVLAREGVDSEQGIHSWRCFDKTRYPEPCTCTEDLARMVAGALQDR